MASVAIVRYLGQFLSRLFLQVWIKPPRSVELPGIVVAVAPELPIPGRLTRANQRAFDRCSILVPSSADERIGLENLGLNPQSMDGRADSRFSGLGSSLGRPVIFHRIALFMFLAVFLAGLIIIRQTLEIGWGNIDSAPNGSAVPLGVAYAAHDIFSYVAWAHQAKDGHTPFSILYTTEAHRALLVIPIFWFVGKAAALFSAHPLFVLNLLMPACALLALIALYRACLEMGLSRWAAFLALAFTAYGAGLSVPMLLLFPGSQWARGADAAYFDLFPMSVFPFYPYQSIGYAMLLGLLWLVLRTERAFREGKYGLIGLLPCVIMAFATVGVRPYEPTVFLAIYAVYTAGALVGQKSAAPARIMILLSIAVGIVPWLFYYHWVFGQPVWSTFANLSFELPIDRVHWLIGFGLFWPAAAYGIWAGLRTPGSNVLLPVLWAAHLFLLLIVVGTVGVKFAGGGFVFLAILAGLAVDDLGVRLSRLKPVARVSGFALLMLAVFSTWSSPLVLFTKDTPDAMHSPIDGEVVAAAGLIKAKDSDQPPTVLTDFETGNLLPALAGVRVYAGHWSLTMNAMQKSHQLTAAGFEANSDRDKLNLPAQKLAYEGILQAAQIDYVLILKERPAFALLNGDPNMRPVFIGERWALFAVGA